MTTPNDMQSLVERMACEAGMSNDGVMWFSPCSDNMDVSSEDLARFAQAIAADIAAQVGGNHILSGSPDWAFSWGWSSANEAAANLIRDRYGLERTVSFCGGGKPVIEYAPPAPLVWEDDQNEQQRTE